jgi:diamine N-acetyltransferase
MKRMPPAEVQISVRAVDASNWRDCAAVSAAGSPNDFVKPVCYYLALCHYGGVWHPLALYAGDKVVGFAMWAVDPADQSGWLGGVTITADEQGRGLGRTAVAAALEYLRAQGCVSAALSYAPDNERAKHVYASLGFVETGEMEDDELVARRAL